MPRGLALGSVSGMLGKPVEEEKRTVIGVDGALKCGADVRSEAEEVGVKVPVSRRPFAWAALGVFVNYCHQEKKTSGLGMGDDEYQAWERVMQGNSMYLV